MSICRLKSRAAVGYTSIARENHVDAMSGAPLLGSRNERKLYALEQEKERIMTALNMHGGNVSRAAKELNISRNTLYRKMRNLNIRN